MPSRIFEQSAEQWAALRRLLGQALDLPPDERSRWVDELAGPDTAFQPQLRALLAAEHASEMQGLLGTLPKVETGEFASLRTDRISAGQDMVRQVGPYRLLRPLGEGGMATVWLAERTDLLQSRKVALKLPHGAWRRAGLVERMAREREILASLEHPNIARLYDAGVAEDGQPYLALEHVEGLRIDQYCKEHALGMRQKLGLFLQVAQAVAHAHAHLVVHRDLKPSNILVTPGGEVRLLDFGVAKLLAQGGAEQSELTREVGQALTPEYAAPEQVSGDAVGTGVDIYALGVVLCELLTGERPYPLKKGLGAALEQAILQAEPRRPSDIVNDDARRRALRGDLDAIVLKALRKLPAERYATVDAMADDIDRHLLQLPVRAKAASQAYRLRKFVLRNRLAVGAFGAVFGAVLAGAALALWQANVAIMERNRAEEVRAFIESIFRDTDPYQEAQAPMSVVALLQKAHRRVGQELSTRPEVRVEMLDLIGASLRNLQALDAAADAIDDAVATANTHLGPWHSLTLRVRLTKLELLRFQGKSGELDKELGELLPALRQDHANPGPWVAALLMAAHSAIDSAHYEKAIAAAREALDVALARLGERDDQAARAAIVLSLSHEYARQPAQALASAEQALRLALMSHADKAPHPTVIEARGVLARALGEVGQLGPAIDQLRQAVQDTAARFGDQAIEVAFQTHTMVKFLLEAGEVEQAEQAARQAREIFRQRASAGAYFYPLARSSHANTLSAARRAALALPEAQEAYAELGTILAPPHPVTNRVREELAWTHALLGHAEQADQLLQESAPKGPTAWRTLHVQSVAARLRGRPSEALALARAAQAAIAGGHADIDRMRTLPNLGLALVDSGAAAEALPVLQQAEALLKRFQKKPSPEMADVALGLGRAQLALGRPDLALGSLQQADAHWRGVEADRRWGGEAAFWLARAHQALGQDSLARETQARAREGLAGSALAIDVALLGAPPSR